MNGKPCFQKQQTCVLWSIPVQGKLKMNISVYGMIPLSQKCILNIKTWLKQIQWVQSKLTKYLQAVQEAMKQKCNEESRHTTMEHGKASMAEHQENLEQPTNQQYGSWMA